MADDITLTAETGRTTGSAASRRLRANGKVPAVLYGRGADPVPLTVDWRELRAALTTDKGLNALLTLKVGSKKTKALVKDMQRHPVRRDVLHIDFLAVDVDVVISTDVPILLEGEATLVIREQGVVDQVMNAIVIQAKPDDIPGHLSIDVSELEIGHTITVADLDLPAGVTTEVDPEETVVTAQVSSLALAEEEEGEGEGRGRRGRGRRRRGGRGRRGRGRRARRRRVRRVAGGSTPAPWRCSGGVKRATPAAAPPPTCWSSASATRRRVRRLAPQRGAEVVDVLAERHGGTPKRSRSGLVDEVRIDDHRVALAFPLTYVNLSGESVAQLVRRYGITDPERIVIVQDELDLPVGKLKVKRGAGWPATTGCAPSSSTSTPTSSSGCASASASRCRRNAAPTTC